MEILGKVEKTLEQLDLLTPCPGLPDNCQGTIVLIKCYVTRIIRHPCSLVAWSDYLEEFPF